ncbi:hypothetical protein RRG08_057132 [Elysia crispata]|uniref:Morc S5 domain-containing protein n=1 Tax=Elysia crispata TaxID=231223 RepID=A0AAE1CNA1_9GAST|nr:hypothetical protein RRG08_057132 [Elysia crispata]
MRPTLIQVLLPSLHHQTATIPFQSKGSTVDRLKTIQNSRINKHDLMQRGEDYCRKMDYCTILFLEPKMTIHIRGKTVRSKSVSYSLNDKNYFDYRPRNEEKPIRITFGFTFEDEKTENYGMMLYHRNRLIKAFERVGCQKQSQNAHGTGVVGVAEVDFLEPIHTKQDFIRNEMFNNAMKSFGDKLNRYWDMKRTTRVLRNTRNRRGGRGESRDPATNLTPPKREINLGILDNPRSPVNQNQTQKSHSIGGIGMALRDEGRATNNQADSPVQRTEEPTSSVHAQREMSAAQSKPELKTEINELQTDIDKSNSEEVEMSAAQKIEELETEIDKLNTEKDEMSETQEAETYELKMEINELKREIAKLNYEKVEMNTTQEMETHELKKEINELRTEITKLKREKKKMSDTKETETHELKKEIKELKTEIDKLKTEKNELTSEKRYGSKRKKMS